MGRTTIPAIVTGIVLWSSVVFGEPLPLTPGYYEVTAIMSVSGKPDKRHRCVTPDHLANPEAVLNYAFSIKNLPFPDHTVTNFSLQGGKISYDVDTPHALIHVEGTISSTEFSVERSHKGKSGKVLAVPMTMTLTGKRTGDCKGK